MRVLAVPRGMPSDSLISSAVRPYTAASTTARRCSCGSTSSARRTVRRTSPRLAASSGRCSVPCSADSVKSSGSVGVARRRRSASMARLRVMVSTHEATDPRRGSKTGAWRQARTMASWATSSDTPASLVME